MAVQGEDTVIRCPPPVCGALASLADRLVHRSRSLSSARSKRDAVSGWSLRVRSLEQPERLGLLLVCPSLDDPCLRRPLRTPGLTPGRGSGSLVSRILGFVFPLGSRPFDHRRDLLRQPGQVSVVEGLDVRVGRGLLHPDGGPASLDGHDDLQVLRLTVLRLGVVSVPCGSCAGLLVGVLLLGNRSSGVLRRFAEETLVNARGVRAGCFRSGCRPFMVSPQAWLLLLPCFMCSAHQAAILHLLMLRVSTVS